MIKKLIVATGVGLLLVAICLGRDMHSYWRTSVGCLKDAVRNSVPVEFELQRAQQMIKDLVPEVRKNMHLIAQEEVDLQRLESQIADSAARLAKEKQQMNQLKDALVSAKGALVFAGRKYTGEQVKTDLANRFDRYKTGEATLKSLQQIHTARQRSLDAARQRLEGTLVAKRQLQVEVENLQARNEMVAAARTTSNYNFDETRLGRVKELIANLRTRLDVDERLANADSYFHDEIPLEKAAPEDIVGQVSRYFDDAQAAPDAAEVAKK